MKWNTEDLEKAIELHKLGKRFEEIAQILKRTTRSVDLKLKKNGLYAHRKIKITTELVYCKNCSKEFKSSIKDHRKFCSFQCSNEFNNKNRPRRERLKFCLNCGKKLMTHQYKYCSIDCQNELRWKDIVKKIENGDTTLYERNYKKYLIHKHGNKCMDCGWDEINPTTGLIPIQLEHIDGNSENHNLSNLKLLCPNCHSLTPTYGALNKGNGRTKRREKRRNQRKEELIDINVHV